LGAGNSFKVAGVIHRADARCLDPCDRHRDEGDIARVSVEAGRTVFLREETADAGENAPVPQACDP
jgi:hypothetical protein